MTTLEKAKHIVMTGDCKGFLCEYGNSKNECPCRESLVCTNGGNKVAFCKDWLVKHDTPEDKPVTEFKVGHWYKWVGPKDYRENWNALMEAWKDGKPRECVNSRVFKGISDIHGYPAGWDYTRCMQHFREVPAPDAPEMKTYKTTIHWLGKQPEIVSAKRSVKSKAQRRKEILSRLSIE